MGFKVCFLGFWFCFLFLFFIFLLLQLFWLPFCYPVNYGRKSQFYQSLIWVLSEDEIKISTCHFTIAVPSFFLFSPLVWCPWKERQCTWSGELHQLAQHSSLFLRVKTHGHSNVWRSIRAWIVVLECQGISKQRKHHSLREYIVIFERHCISTQTQPQVLLMIFLTVLFFNLENKIIS